ncbi:DsbA family protein [Candidatus Micrarchaeota archaeon]|nr:DsbA family protein [Candidatus Micrarchaeota archaeon]
MVLCIVALFVFAVLGIFSARYRSLAGEAFRCVFKTITLRPCDTGLDRRIKNKIIIKTMQRSPKLARVLNQNFHILSIAFTLLFFASMAYSAVSVYNYFAFGNCNGPNSPAFCVFDEILGRNPTALKPVLPGVGPVLGNGSIKLVEFGCFSCPYTRETQQALKEFLAKHPEVALEFRALPIQKHEDSFISAQAAFCALEQDRFWQYHDSLFADVDHSEAHLKKIAERLGLDVAVFSDCLPSDRSKQRVDKDIEAGVAAGIYGTPAFFLGNASRVGPQTEPEFENLLKGYSSPFGQHTTGACALPEN